MSVTIEKTFNLLPHIASTLHPAVDRALDDGVVTLIEVADPLTPRDTGNLVENKTVNEGVGWREVIWNMHYAAYQEFGTHNANGDPWVPASLFASTGADAAIIAIDRSLAAWPGR